MRRWRRLRFIRTSNKHRQSN
ncbi:hypothetical protein [Ignavibacterium album]